MTIKEIYAIVKELEDHVEETCCAVTLDPLDVKDLVWAFANKLKDVFPILSITFEEVNDTEYKDIPKRY